MKQFLAALSVALLAPLAIASAEINNKDFQAALQKYLATEDGQKAVAEAAEAHFKRRQAAQKEQQAAKQKEEMEKQFANPVDLPIENSPVKGPEKAKVTIFEFSDFECPFCSRARNTMKAVAKKYPNDVRFVFKNLPLGFHKNAKPAAQAALAAGEQGKFWEMYDKLFDNQRSLNMETYVSTAKELGLDVEKFKKDMESEKVLKQIASDEALAAKHGVRGTPGFFVNGVAVRGAYPVEHFAQIIDRWLKKG